MRLENLKFTFFFISSGYDIKKVLDFACTGNDYLTCSTGSGDVDTSTVVKADDNCCITGASGMSLNLGIILQFVPILESLTCLLKI